jgi:hypothetical protein
MESFIQLTGKVTTLPFERLQCIPNTEISGNVGGKGLVLENGIWGNIPLTEDLVSYSFLYLDDESLRGRTGFNLLVIVLETGTHSRDKNTVVLVLRHEEGYYERVGLLITRHRKAPRLPDSHLVSAG